MTVFGVIMTFIAMGWTLFLILVLVVLGDIYVFLRGPAVLFFTIGYVVIILANFVIKKVFLSM